MRKYAKFSWLLICILKTIISKVGPTGGPGGNARDTDPTDVDRITKISIYYSDDVIYGFSWDFERNGRAKSTDLWGTKSGTLKEVPYIYAPSNIYLKLIIFIIVGA